MLLNDLVGGRGLFREAHAFRPFSGNSRVSCFGHDLKHAGLVASCLRLQKLRRVHGLDDFLLLNDLVGGRGLFRELGLLRFLMPGKPGKSTFIVRRDPTYVFESRHQRFHARLGGLVLRGSGFQRLFLFRVYVTQRGFVRLLLEIKGLRRVVVLGLPYFESAIRCFHVFGLVRVEHVRRGVQRRHHRTARHQRTDAREDHRRGAPYLDRARERGGRLRDILQCRRRQFHRLGVKHANFLAGLFGSLADLADESRNVDLLRRRFRFYLRLRFRLRGGLKRGFLRGRRQRVLPRINPCRVERLRCFGHASPFHSRAGQRAREFGDGAGKLVVLVDGGHHQLAVNLIRQLLLGDTLRQEI